MRRTWYWLAGPAVALAGVVAACGGDGNERTFRGADGGEVTLSENLPDGWPDDFPIYADADLQGSYRGESGGVEGLVATWTTGDDVDEVGDWYADELSDGEWTSTSEGDLGGPRFFSAANSDESKVAYVNVSESDGETVILVTISDDPTGGDGGDGDEPTPDDGSDRDTTDDASDGGGNGSGAAQLPDEVDLDDDFPSDLVRMPDGARITSSSSVSAGGTTSHFLELYARMSADEAEDFFANEMPDAGWQEALRTSADGESFLTFSRGAGEDAALGGDSATILISDADVEGYVWIGITVALVDE